MDLPCDNSVSSPPLNVMMKGYHAEVGHTLTNREPSSVRLRAVGAGYRLMSGR